VAVITKVQDLLADVAKVESASKLEGMQLIMVLAPK
jgi:translation initiation factor IF-3